MARYIRTKDGFYKVSHLNAYATHKRKGETLLEGYKTAYIKNENIIAQSENLEDLCDKFVVIDKETKEVMNIIAFLEYAKHWVSWKYNIYGAIWTDKGLQFVARMNSKGELELL